MTGRFSAVGDRLATARGFAATALLRDGRVLLAGGKGDGAIDLASAELYEPENARFVAAGTMPAGRSRGVATALDDGQVFICGGVTPDGTTGSALIYHPASNTFTEVPASGAARTDHTATTLRNGEVLVAVGSHGFALNSAELYVPSFVRGVTIRPAAPAIISSTAPNLTVNIEVTGTSGTTDTVTVTLTDAAGALASAAATITIGAGGAGTGSVDFAVAALGTATIAATDTGGTTIAPTSVIVQPSGFALEAPPAFRSGADTPVRITALAAGGADASHYAGTPRLASPAAPAATHDAHFSGACPRFSGAIGTCLVNLGDLGRRVFGATDGVTTAFDPVSVAPNGFSFSATDPSGNTVDLATYRSGAPFTLLVTAIAKTGADNAGYDGVGFSVALSSNDGTPLARTASPSAGVTTFTDVRFVKLGGQPGSPFTPRLTATDGHLPSSTGSRSLVVGPASLTAAPAGGAVRSGTPFALTITADASSGMPGDRAAYTGTVTVTAPVTAAANPIAPVTFAPSGAGTASVPITLRSLGVQRVTVRETAVGVAATVQRTVSPLALAFASGPTVARPGDTAYYTIVPVAAAPGSTTAYTGTVTLSATGAAATVAPPLTKPCAPDCAFAVTFVAAGTVTLGATDASAPPATAPARTVTVSAPSSLSVAPATLAFGATFGGGDPAAQTLNVGHLGGSPLAWAATAATSGGGAWLRLDRASGTTPATVSVSVATAGLNPGTYAGAITIAAGDATNGPQTVGVTLTVARQTFALALGASPGGGGTVTAEPASGPYRPGTVVTLHPRPATGWLFTGWTVDGADAGWAAPLTLTMVGEHQVTARFAPRPAFTDLSSGQPAYSAVTQLAARGIIRGYGDGRFGPNDTALRAQMAALICRSMGWDAEEHGNPFTDRGSIDADLWRNVGTLAYHGVARGYGDGTYRPTNRVLQAQVISFIARAMVAKGYWTMQPDNPALYPNVPAASGHRQDLATFVHYAGALPGTAASGAWVGWDRAATRGWFAQVLWQALNSHFAVDNVP